jgi:hypothetical protein
MSSLAAVDSSGVSQVVIDGVAGQFRRYLENPANTNGARWRHLTVNMTVHQRDAEYIVECMRILQHTEINSLLFSDGNISDEAVDVFGGFLRQTLCPVRVLWLWNLPPRQFRRFLEALHTNRSVKELCISSLKGDEGASWIADLLRYKRNFTDIYLSVCCFPFTQIFPLLRGQSALTGLTLNGCSISNSSNAICLFNDSESTQLLIDNILLPPSPSVATLKLFDLRQGWGVSMENRPLMAALHKNTTIVKFQTAPDEEIRRFLAPIALRNIHLAHINAMLGSTSSEGHSLREHATAQQSNSSTTIPPPTELWPTVLAKVGQGSQGATPVFVILCNRLATWIEP